VLLIYTFRRSKRPSDALCWEIRNFHYLAAYWWGWFISDGYNTGLLVASKLFNQHGIKRFSGVSDFPLVLSECTERYYTENLDAVRENFELALQFRSPEMVLEEHLLKQLGLVDT